MLPKARATNDNNNGTVSKAGMGERFWFFFSPGVSAHLEDDRHLDKHARFQIYMTEHAQLKVLET